MTSRGIRVDTQGKPYGVARETLADAEQQLVDIRETEVSLGL
jgi:hypothetical protein